MTLVLEVILTALVGAFPLWLLATGDVVDRVRHRHEHPEQRALRVMADRRWWS